MHCGIHSAANLLEHTTNVVEEVHQKELIKGVAMVDMQFVYMSSIGAIYAVNLRMTPAKQISRTCALYIWKKAFDIILRNVRSAMRL